jgi:hypothetical protein
LHFIFCADFSWLSYPQEASSSDLDQVPPPQSLSLTEFHFLLLYSNRVLAINQLSEEVIWTLPINEVRSEETSWLDDRGSSAELFSATHSS